MLIFKRLTKYTNFIRNYRHNDKVKGTRVVHINQEIPYKTIYKYYNTIKCQPYFQIMYADDMYEIKNPEIGYILYYDYKISKNEYIIKVSKRFYTTEKFANTIKLNFEDEYAYIMSK